MLDFSFQAIQLNRLNWRDYLRQANPVASALMAKMNIASADRPRVKLECLRLLTTLRLNPAKMQLIAGFVNSYLRLDPAETRVFAEELDALPPTEKEPVMNVTNEWTEMGFAQGLHRGKEDLVLRLLRRRFGDAAAALEVRVRGLRDDQLEQLAEAIFEFSSVSDAQTWIVRQN